MTNDALKIKGIVRHQGWDKDGNALFDVTETNVVTNVGKAATTAFLGNVSPGAAFTYLALGTSTTAASATQTALGAEISTNGFARAAATVTQQTTTTTNDTLQLVYTWTATGTQAVNEVGIFNAASVGTMLARQVLAATKNFTTGDTYQVTYKIILS